MANGKPFSIDKPDAAPAEMTKFQAFTDFIVFIALSAAYIAQVSFVLNTLNKKLGLSRTTGAINR